LTGSKESNEIRLFGDGHQPSDDRRQPTAPDEPIFPRQIPRTQAESLADSKVKPKLPLLCDLQVGE
jgi:hypothetical protein